MTDTTKALRDAREEKVAFAIDQAINVLEECGVHHVEGSMVTQVAHALEFLDEAKPLFQSIQAELDIYRKTFGQKSIPGPKTGMALLTSGSRKRKN